MNAIDYFLKEFREYRDDPPQPTLRKRVLLVDDDPNVSMLVKDLLQSRNCEVESANTPRDAIRIVAESLPFSRVIMDLSFPGQMSGIQALRNIKALLPDVPVTIISGYLTGPAEEVAEFEKLSKEIGFDVIPKSDNCWKVLVDSIR